MSRSFSRRAFFGGSAVTAAAVATVPVLSACSTDTGTTADAAVKFDGEHQAGITTAQQDRLHFAAFNVVTTERAELEELLKTWTAMARRMTAGLTTVDEDIADVGQHSVPQDTGEAYDLQPANLTITIGFGPSLFDDRFGLADARPDELADLPKFAGDQLVDKLCGGDIAIQACSDNPQVAVHAIRNLARAGSGVVEYKWSQLGFGHASATTKNQQTPRNLFGFKDGTNNIKAEEEGEADTHIWVSGTNTWFDGGTYLITRRIRMLLENWDRQVLSDQEATFGRVKGSGAPLGRTDEFDALPLDEYEGTSGPIIPLTAHARLAHPQENNGARMLRRAYNFTDGIDDFGHLDAGLFFIALVNSPNERFIPIQKKLAKSDKMNEYVRYESAAIFACPPGTSGDDDWWGRGMFEATA
ncbi:iron uptake transporter deferrochelatase/peroxidase subunit [uncultured Corynebacterium sp.]|mgnify:CR=1 FL=1|uniref:iron uptake transporter deferrochelatase/peroxidase subunit n=1 Tax=uncultured Corynebacterium sp. TaxID=159447 RepID=UPI0025E3E9E3|nr:iron uptake transporter deferrochelatase/peroxidase subunit [uncultured Corynebacterium sp.]